MKTTILWGALALISLAPASLAQAPCYAENDGPTYLDNVMMGGPNLLLGVRFTPPSDLSVTAIEVFTGEGSGTNTVGIWSHDIPGNKPDTDLGTGSWSMSSTNSWQGATLPATIDLTAGTTYWMVWGPQNGAQAAVEGNTFLGQVYRGSFDGGLNWNGPWQFNDRHWKFRFYCDSGPGKAYCFCDTGNPSGNVAPCGNFNDGSDPDGAGCQHDDSDAGARLDASGTASVSNDTLLFVGTRGPISNSTLFFQANNNLDGTGGYLGDGIRCAGGGLIRLKVKTTDANGDADSSPMVVTTRSASFGHVIAPGETLYYQWWIRDSGGSPCGNESNTSNGYEITWQP